MKVLRSPASTTAFCRAAPQPLVLVPTMGALHRGHATLLERARKVAGPEGTVAVSIFVNPTQFGPKEDFSRYPRTWAEDKALCEAHGVNLIFHPEPAEMYAGDASTWVNEESLGEYLCGASRPGHFRGVCTVVLKLFNIIQPTHAVFGLKDFQQLAIIRRMVRDLNVPVHLEAVETEREADGLALSSRNKYLSPEERAQAPVIRQALLIARAAYRAGETRATTLRRMIVRKIASVPAAKIDYVQIADATTLEPLREVRKNSVIAVAAYFGRTRLIDNLWIR